MRIEQTNTRYNAGRRWTIHQGNMGNMQTKAPASGEHRKRTERKKSQSSSCSSSRRKRLGKRRGSCDELLLLLLPLLLLRVPLDI